ncbi:dual specificity protein phosphatase family protein [Rhizobium oryzicola]|uniref:Dual specificity protein phosphatase family protein n=1 Tax=Rhizobium oryzicola TaxID=1232668 RepID=A0ABT8SW79_9HYPH|nr:dual specificity protein phosphatase family protein [Rhizobium oryzicola]MDO1582288.1 dual specificity protein phosphatase family protein [Rhizobium oryzicola]
MMNSTAALAVSSPCLQTSRLRKYLKAAGLTLAGTLLGCGLYLGWLQISGNFHEVIPGQFYRSAQLSPQQLAAYIDRYKIKTVINLRGGSPGAKWYDDEVATVKARDALHVDFAMSANRKLTKEESLQLVALLKNAQGPVLIHCRAGADRTGLASVMYLQQVAGVDEAKAEWQLSPLYGHLNLPFLGAYAMDDTWEAFEKAIGLES